MRSSLRELRRDLHSCTGCWPSCGTTDSDHVRAFVATASRRCAGSPSPSRRSLLHNHRHEIWAADFFTVPTLTLRTLYVFFVVSHDYRRIEHFHVTKHPSGEWVWRQLIEATPWNRSPRFLIRDRDRAYGGDFIARAKRIGIETVLTPVHAPQANAIAERLVGTLRRECVDHIIPLGGAAPPRSAPRVRRLLQRHATTSDAGVGATARASFSPAGRQGHVDPRTRRHPSSLRTPSRRM